jgi:hypothetical protein
MPEYSNNAGTATDLGGGSFRLWASPSNATGASDDTNAVAGTISNPITSETPTSTLDLDNFGFAVPSTETIVGIKVVVRSSSTNDAGTGRLVVNIQK